MTQKVFDINLVCVECKEERSERISTYVDQDGKANEQVVANILESRKVECSRCQGRSFSIVIESDDPDDLDGSFIFTGNW